MRLIFTSYIAVSEYDHPDDWLKRIEGYTGILESLAKDHEVIGIERINYEGELYQKGVQYFFLKLKKKTTKFPFRIHRLIRKLKPDVVFINGFIFPLQIIQLKLTVGRKVKIIVLHRADSPFKGVKRYIQRLADKCVSAYLFASAEFGEQWVQSNIITNPKKIHEVIQASSVFHLSNKIGAHNKLFQGESLVYLWVGRLDENKDPLTVIKAFLKFKEKNSAAKLYMIFQSNELLTEITNLVAVAQAKDTIHLVGKISHADLQDWYNASDFILSSSYYESNGVAICEAMSCGCIPILTNIMSFRKMTGPGKCGILYDAGNEQGLLTALLQTLQLDIEKERIKVLEQFQNELSFDAIAKKINRIIETN